MTTGSWCFTEILMSVKPCSSNREHSHSADSTSASGVALPYLASSRLSSDPALTPIRIGVPDADAARAISPTLSSNVLMLPGFTRTAAQPASIAAKTYLGWKWMSAMTGICDLRAISGSASASSCDGTATRTIWQPAAVSSAICCSVALTSAVSVVVIDCTEIGAPPPARAEAGEDQGQLSCRYLALHRDVDRVEDVSGDQQGAEADEHGKHEQAQRHQPLDVDEPWIGPAAQPIEPGPDPLDNHHRQVAAVERQQREQVERPDEDVQRGDQVEQHRDLRLPGQRGLDNLTGQVADADDAAHLASRGAGPVLVEQVRDGRRQLADGRGRRSQGVGELRP